MFVSQKQNDILSQHFVVHEKCHESRQRDGSGYIGVYSLDSHAESPGIGVAKEEGGGTRGPPPLIGE